MRDGEPMGVLCQCRQRKSLARKLKASGLTPEQAAYRIENYSVSPENQKMFNGIKRYLQAWPALIDSDSSAKGFYLTGPVGIGKTMLACIITRSMLEKGVPAVFVPSADLIAELRHAQFSEEDGMESKIDTLANVPALILDDVGKEKLTAWVQSLYYRLIDLRNRKNLLTGFTSNYNLVELEERLGEVGPATVSRIIGMTQDYVFFGGGADMRWSKGKSGQEKMQKSGNK